MPPPARAYYAPVRLNTSNSRNQSEGCTCFLVDVLQAQISSVATSRSTSTGTSTARVIDFQSKTRGIASFSGNLKALAIRAFRRSGIVVNPVTNKIQKRLFGAGCYFKAEFYKSDRRVRANEFSTGFYLANLRLTRRVKLTSSLRDQAWRRCGESKGRRLRTLLPGLGEARRRP